MLTFAQSLKRVIMGIGKKVKMYMNFTKFRLAALVILSALSGYLFVGGSSVSRQEFSKTVDFIKSNSTIPLVIFPGSAQQISPKADALLYLSLLSGRNPDFLIGHHVQSATELFEMDL